MCISYRSRYNALSNIRFPTAPKHLQEIRSVDNRSLGRQNLFRD